MPIVLVVDDSEVDRRLVGGLLARDIDWLVEFASNGREALELMQTTEPDVIVTDLMMPDMDGMELVTQVAVQHPNVPVILVTAQGSEEVAVEALSRGAASYVPKDQLADKLLETVEQVMALEKADRHYNRLIGCLTRAEYQFELDNDPALVPPLVDLLQQMLMGMQCCGTTTRMHAGVALEEALLNAMLHGNLELTPEEVQETRAHLRQGADLVAAAERRLQEPYCHRKVFVQAKITPSQAEFKIRDEGSGFDVSQLPARGDPQTLQHASGRGLVLMQNFMDDVVFNEQGNEVVMRLECHEPSEAASV
ncbi:MAG TPA: response regulator [Planctomycetaceae bacterium]|nr:response regulator [Planctomycetaceae bacterium]